MIFDLILLVILQPYKYLLDIISHFRTFRRIRRKNFLVHPSWKAIFDGLNQENNFYRRRGLVVLLKPYCKEIPLHFDDNAVQSSFLNSSK